MSWTQATFRRPCMSWCKWSSTPMTSCTRALSPATRGTCQYTAGYSCREHSVCGRNTKVFVSCGSKQCSGTCSYTRRQSCFVRRRKRNTTARKQLTCSKTRYR
ncbi:hypothetical protein NP493_2273g00009 [Ridgeia piscesae]|uniref:Uncharacterized protein n=1 Tax=Ridgeia piscesae TaxID=27915 RepID=A0AAD9JK36_RIDPI|nr:hypothetical protein NP493_2273g00009 [Ridgeia piscesae]